MSRLSGRNRVTESQYRQYSFNRDIASLLPRSCFGREGGFHSSVKLIHFTLQEYRAHPELFGTAHSIMAETCLSYLNSHHVKALSTSPSPDLQGTPFLEYSSLYWGAHARRDHSESAKLLALKLFDDGYDNHISTKLLLKAQKPLSRTVAFDKPSLFSSLHFACIFGIVEIVDSLVQVEGCDINQHIA